MNEITVATQYCQVNYAKASIIWFLFSVAWHSNNTYLQQYATKVSCIVNSDSYRPHNDSSIAQYTKAWHSIKGNAVKIEKDEIEKSLNKVQIEFRNNKASRCAPRLTV